MGLNRGVSEAVFFCRLLGLGLVFGGARGLPQGYGTIGGGGGGLLPEVPLPAPSNDGCNTVFKTVQEITYTEEFKDVCETYTEKKCETKYREACTPYQDQECEDILRDQCNTLYRDECKENTREVEEPYTEDVCSDVPVQVCEKRWVEIGYNDRVWQDDPSTCKELVQTKCAPVQKVRYVAEPYTVCDKVPYNDCRKIPDQVCRPVTRQDCQQEPWEDCYDVPNQKCRKYHTKTPNQTTKRIPVRVCPGNPFPTDSNIVINARTTAEEAPADAGEGDVLQPRSGPEEGDVTTESEDQLIFSA